MNVLQFSSVFSIQQIFLEVVHVGFLEEMNLKPGSKL